MTASADTAIIAQVWRRCAGTATLAEIQRLPGHSHRVYACTPDQGRALIVRLGDPGRARFALEAALLRRCTDDGVAAVPVVRHVGVEEADGQTAAVMVLERARGERLSEFARRVGPARAAESVACAGETLHAVHQVRTSGFGPLDSALGGPAARLGDWFIDGLTDKAERAKEVDPSAGDLLDRGMQLLEDHRRILDASTPGLLHGDFSPDNILVDEHGRISAVLDWEAAKSGPPEMDIGWWDCFFDTSATPAEQLVAGYTRRAPFEEERLRTVRHLTVVRVMIGHFTWTLSVGDRSGVRYAADRLRQEVTTADGWSAAG